MVVRAQTVIALGKQKERAPLESLLQMLQDEDEQVRSNTVKALGELGDRAPINILLSNLQNPSHPTRLAAASTLQHLAAQGQPIPVESLVPALADLDEDVRVEVVRTLGALGEQMPIDVLVTALGDGSLCEESLCALENAGDRLPIEPVLAALGNANYYGNNIREWAWLLLKKTHSEALPPVIQEAQDILSGRAHGPILGSLSYGFLAELIGEVEQPSPGMFEMLTHLLDWHYWEVRQKAAQALGKLRRNIPDAAIRRLLELRHDPQSYDVRMAADDALVEILSLETGIEDD